MDKLKQLKQYADIFGRGLVSEMAPELAAGILVELFRMWRVDVAMVTRDVNNNRSLWDSLEQNHRNRLKKVARRIGNLDWVSTNWAIEAIKKEYPGVASLILGWTEAHDWLEGQVQELKELLQDE